MILLVCYWHRLTLEGFFTRVWVTASLLTSQKTLLSIQPDLKIAWIVSFLPPISICSNPLSNHLGTVPNVPTTSSITVTRMFLFFFFFFFVLGFFCKIIVLIDFSLSFIFTLWSAVTVKIHLTISSLIFFFFLFFFFFC